MQLTLKSIKPLLFSASGLVLLVAFFLLGSALTPTDTHAEVATIVGATGYYLNTTSSTDSRVDLSISSTAAGTMKMTKETLTTKTNSPSGYQLYIGMANDTNALYRDEDSENGLAATSGTYAEPATLGTNTWGYAVPQNDNTALESNNKFNTGTYVDGGSDQTSLWASVPAHGEEQLVQKTNAEDESGTDLNVYYAAKINSALTSGVYKGTVVYTAVALANSAHVASVSPSVLDSLTGGDELTITVGISTPAASISSSSILVGEASCPVTSVTNNADGTLKLTCTAPAQSLSGRYDVAIDLAAYGKFYIANGVEYKTAGGSGDDNNFVVVPNSARAGFSRPITIYLPTLTYSTFSLSSVYIGDTLCTSPSVQSNNIYIITCTVPATITEGKYTLTVTAQVDSSEVTYSGSFTVTNTPYDLYEIANLQDISIYPAVCNNTAVGVTNTLTDTRDGKQYRVRKLSDGSCWMIDNLKFGTPNTTITLSPDSSDVETQTTFTVLSNSGNWPWGDSYDPNNKSHHIYTRNNSYGNLYSWYTATAQSAIYTSGSNAPHSICPKGWKIPTYDNHASLYSKYNSYSNMTSTVNGGPEFVLGGQIDSPYSGVSVTSEGSIGYYWSRTSRGQSSTTYTYSKSRPYLVSTLTLTSSSSGGSVSTDDYSVQFAQRGSAIRCVAP